MNMVTGLRSGIKQEVLNRLVDEVDCLRAAPGILIYVQKSTATLPAGLVLYNVLNCGC